jgi:hypothetical protein
MSFWDEGEDDVEYPDFDPNEYMPEGFLPDDASEDEITTLSHIRDIIGQPFGDLVATYDQILGEGRAGQVRAVNFSSGSEALLWLFRRGIFMYSSLIHYKDGTWGVAIGDSPGRPSEANSDEPAF